MKPPPPPSTAQQHTEALESVHWTISANTDVSQPSVIPKNVRKAIWRLVASVISLYMYMTYMQVLFLVHTVLAGICSLKSKRSRAVHSPPLHLLLAERRQDILQRNRTSFSLNAGGKSVIFFPRFKDLEFLRYHSHQVLDVLVLLSCYELFFGQVPGWLP